MWKNLARESYPSASIFSTLKTYELGDHANQYHMQPPGPNSDHVKRVQPGLTGFNMGWRSPSWGGPNRVLPPTQIRGRGWVASTPQLLTPRLGLRTMLVITLITLWTSPHKWNSIRVVPHPDITDVKSRSGGRMGWSNRGKEGVHPRLWEGPTAGMRYKLKKSVSQRCAHKEILLRILLQITPNIHNKHFLLSLSYYSS